MRIANLLLGLEVVEEDLKCRLLVTEVKWGTRNDSYLALGRHLTPVLNNDAGAVDDLAGVALTVKDA